MGSSGLAAVAGQHATGTAAGLLSGTAYYLHWGVIQISLTNFVIIVMMVVLFALALVLPFPGARAQRTQDTAHDDAIETADGSHGEH